MKMLALAFLILLSACVARGELAPPPPNMVVAYADLALDSPAGRAELALRVSRAVRSFCAAYDPQHDEAIFDVRLASERNCPGAATLLLVQHMPAAVRQAWRAGARGE
jgi:UrcA family protein